MRSIRAEVAAASFTINGFVLKGELPLEHYLPVLGPPDRSFGAGDPAPAGFRNNQVHAYDNLGIYLTEHHATRLIQSVNFVFDCAKCPFEMQKPYLGELRINATPFRVGMSARELHLNQFQSDLPGEYHLETADYWVGISTAARRTKSGSRSKVREIKRVSICLR